jgi:Ca-activated chloride channel family protein
MKNGAIEQKKSWRESRLDPGNLLLLVYIAVMVCFLLAGGLTDSHAAMEEQADGVQPGEVLRGELLVAMEDGRLQPAPLVSQQVKMTVSGIVARVVVEQHFVNPGASWIEALYVFPLPDESSVDHLRLRVGERLLEGQIMEKEEAVKTHERAKSEGRKSSLLVQNRANIFTTRVANIGPGEEVTVEIEYQQEVRFSDGIFSLRFPMVVGPRYIPGQPLAERAEAPLTVNATGWAKNTDQVPDASEITPPVDLAGETTLPVDLTIDLAAGIPLSRIDSLYHGIVSEEVGNGHYTIRLTGEIKADRDFVLEWQPAQTGDARAALFAETLGNDQYMLLMLMPPQAVDASPVPREVIFILDVSGSMAGTSILQAKAAISMALGSLRPADHFNLIVFNNDARALFQEARPADRDHIAEARRFIDQLKADGGTEMKPALMLALDGSHHHSRLRQVVFLTDGAVGNEDALLNIIAKRLGDSRLFTVGIGSAPNSYFMTRAATMGRGTFAYIGSDTEVKKQMTNLFAKLENPVITDLRLELAGSEFEAEAYPSPLPDLYLGEPVVLAVRTGWENGTLRLTGTRLGKPWETLVDTAIFGPREGIGALWARKKIRSQMEALALGADPGKTREVVLQTALAHHLVSKYTSLVAVDSEISRPPQENVAQAAVKTHLPQGWQAAAVFGGAAKTATPAKFRVLFGCFILVAAGVIDFLWNRRWRNICER